MTLAVDVSTTNPRTPAGWLDLGYSRYCERFACAFDRFARATDEHGLIGQLVRQVIRAHRTPIKSLIDVGAGPGLVLNDVPTNGMEMVAVEPNFRFLSRLERGGFSVLQDYAETASMDRQFDLLLLSHVLYYIDETDRSAVLEKLTSWVRLGGVALVVLDLVDEIESPLLPTFLPKVGGSSDLIRPSAIRSSLSRWFDDVSERRFEARLFAEEMSPFLDALRFYLEPHEIEPSVMKELEAFAETCRTPSGFELPMKQVMLVAKNGV